jgi:hypothetical protein
MMGQIVSLLARFEEMPGRYVEAVYQVHDVSLSFGLDVIIQEMNKRRMPGGALRVLQCDVGKTKLLESCWRVEGNDLLLRYKGQTRRYDISHDGGHLCEAWPEGCECPPVEVSQ